MHFFQEALINRKLFDLKSSRIMFNRLVKHSVHFYSCLKQQGMFIYIIAQHKRTVCMCVLSVCVHNVCMCVCVCVHVYVVYEDTNLYNDLGMT